MKYDVIAYCWNDALAGFTQEDARRLTHVNLAFGLIKDGLLDLHLLKYLHLLPRLRLSPESAPSAFQVFFPFSSLPCQSSESEIQIPNDCKRSGCSYFW